MLGFVMIFGYYTTEAAEFFQGAYVEKMYKETL